MKTSRILLLSLAIICIAILLSGTYIRQANAVKLAVPLSPGEGETWRYGVAMTGGPNYTLMEGRSLSDNAIFRPGPNFNYYYVFPASSSVKTVLSAQIYILERSGSWTGDNLLSMQTYQFNGVPVNFVSATTINLDSSPIGTWIPVTLSSTPGDLLINPGQFLAFNLPFGCDPAGLPVIKLLFEVRVD